MDTTLFRRRALLIGGLAVSLAAPSIAISEQPSTSSQQIGLQPSASARLADLGVVRLEYWDTGGSGVPVVLLHPATGSAAIWSYQRTALQHAGFRVFAYSRRGFGHSETGPMDDPGTGPNDLEALVRHLGLSRFHLVGSAHGAFIALDYAIAHPERVISVTLANSLGGVDEPEWASDTELLIPKGWQDLPADFRELSASYRLGNPDGRARWMDLEAQAIPGRRVIQKPLNKVDFAALGRMTTPVLVLTGDSDPYMPPLRARRLASHFSNAQVAVIAEAGHSAYWEQPDAFDRVLVAFLHKNAGYHDRVGR